MFTSQLDSLTARFDQLHITFPRTKSFHKDNAIIRSLLRDISIEEVNCRRCKLATHKYKELITQLEKYFQYFEEYGMIDTLTND